MFERSVRMHAEVYDLLSRRGFGDVDSPYNNQFSNRLSQFILSSDGPTIERAHSAVVFSSCPEYLELSLPLKDPEFWSWMQPDARLYPPAGLFVPSGDSRPIAHGYLATLPENRSPQLPDLWRKYLLICDTGYVEMGVTEVATYKDVTYFSLVGIVARYWQFVRFVHDLLRRYGDLRSFQTRIHLRNSNGAVLHDLGEGWREPSDLRIGSPPACLDTNVVIESSFLGPDSSNEEIESRIRSAAADLEFAFGGRKCRAFNHPNQDPTEGLKRVESY